MRSKKFRSKLLIDGNEGEKSGVRPKLTFDPLVNDYNSQNRKYGNEVL